MWQDTVSSFGINLYGWTLVFFTVFQSISVGQELMPSPTFFEDLRGALDGVKPQHTPCKSMEYDLSE